MSTHRPHPIVDEDHEDHEGTILFDDCPRCDEHVANSGIELDRETWGKMWARMVRVEIHDDEVYRSNNEIELGKEMRTMMLLMDKHHEVISSLNYIKEGYPES